MSTLKLTMFMTCPAVAQSFLTSNLYWYRPSYRAMDFGSTLFDTIDGRLGALARALQVDTASKVEPQWTASDEHWKIKIATPSLEHDSLSASLSTDGSTLEVSGKRQIDGCTCGEQVFRHVALPHTPRPEEIDLTYDVAERYLLVQIRRRTKAQAVPLTVKLVKTDDAAGAPLRDKVVQTSAREEGSHSLSNGSHIEVKQKALEESEARLMEKFRATSDAAYVPETSGMTGNVA